MFCTKVFFAINVIQSEELKQSLKQQIDYIKNINNSKLDISVNIFENKLEDSLQQAKEIAAQDDSVLFVIFSDKHVHSKELIQEIIKLQSSSKWTFLYVCTSDMQDFNLNIPNGNIFQYEPNTYGFNAMSCTQIKYLGAFFTARSYGTKSTKGFYGSDS